VRRFGRFTNDASDFRGQQLQGLALFVDARVHDTAKAISASIRASLAAIALHTD
jgi:hypothetical protein